MAKLHNTHTGEDVNVPDVVLTPEYENPQLQPPKRSPKVPKDKSEKLVEIICIVENRPWIEILEENEDGDEVLVQRPMKHKERAKVAEWIADILIANNHAVRV